MASLYFFAINIILNSYQILQITIIAYSKLSSTSLRAPCYKIKANINNKLHVITTNVSNIFHQIKFPRLDLKYFFPPASLILNRKSSVIKRFIIISSEINKAESAITNPSIIVTIISNKLKKSKPM